MAMAKLVPVRRPDDVRYLACCRRSEHHLVYVVEAISWCREQSQELSRADDFSYPSRIVGVILYVTGAIVYVFIAC